ncbi:MAG: matrixin family metalloprotease, partial [Planctomycetaceae bacterium]|nr:matrixin family metalloprotease [Planctomycetaceae bacterium]
MRRSEDVRPAEALEIRRLLTLNIQIDYSFDTNQFFADSSRRAILEQVAFEYESRITDSLDAITPSGQNSWTATFTNPSTGATGTVNNPTIPANTVIVYVGGRDLPSGLGLGGPGGYSASGSASWFQAIEGRGEAGVVRNSTTDTDFAPWGGSISFDNRVTWNFSTSQPTSGQNDFYSVALHEMGHLLGFGTSESFTNNINRRGQFDGTNSVQVFGGSVPLFSDNSHFASGTMSTLPGTTTAQEAALDPELTTGTRKLLTALDWAAFDDLGWDVSAVAAPMDYGDAPDGASGTGTGNYNTRAGDNGPSHEITSNLSIGLIAPDSDSGTQQNSTATADDASGTDDEDLSSSLQFTEGVATSISVQVVNATGTTATLYGWVDFNGDGVFSNTTERASVAVPTGSTNGTTVTLAFPAVPAGSVTSTFARFRLSTSSAASSPTGPAPDGEVEDHVATVSPAATAFDSLPSFTWPATSGAVRYELEVTNVTGGQSNVVILQSNLTGTSFRPTDALPAGTYSWRYRPHNGTQFLAFSSPQQFTILETTGTPFLTDPVTAAVDSLPTFAWSPVANATRYELWVNAESQVTHDRIIYQSNLTTTSYRPDFGLPAGNYTAWVRAYVNGTATSWSSAYTFTLNTSSTSVLTDPVASSTDTAPTFAWLPMNVSSYQLRVSNATTGASVLSVNNLTGTSYTPETSLPPGNYTATIQGGTTAASSPVSFQVESVTGGAQLTYRGGDAENGFPTLDWTSVSGANRYELWVTDLTRGISPVIRDSSLTGTAYQSTQPLPPGSYRAWVRAYSGSTAVGPWSDAVDFRVVETTSELTIWTPSGSTANTAPVIHWSARSGAAGYSVTVRTSTGQTVISQPHLTTNWLTPDVPLSAGTYEVLVSAYDAAGTTLTSVVSTLFIDAPGSSTTIYGPKGLTSDSRPTISWNAVSGATRYFLWLNDATRNINQYILENNVQSTFFVPNDALPAGDYIVWVRPFNGATPLSSWSSAVKFSVTSLPAGSIPIITSPLPDTTNTVPTITWTAISGAVSYEVVIDDVTNSQNAIVSTRAIAGTSYRPPRALPPGQYAVRVRSFSATGAPSAFSEDLNLTVSFGTSAVFVSPLANTTTDADNAFFAWVPVSGAASYEIWVSNLTTSEVLNVASLTGVSYTPDAGVLAPGNYRAWIRQIGATGATGAWSTGYEFTLAATDESAADREPASSVQALVSLSVQPDLQSRTGEVVSPNEVHDQHHIVATAS